MKPPASSVEGSFGKGKGSSLELDRLVQDKFRHHSAREKGNYTIVIIEHELSICEQSEQFSSIISCNNDYNNNYNNAWNDH